jgi:tetraacyldisaccharide 4'-kinase
MYRIHPAIAPAVYIPGLLFEALVRARNRLYERSLLPRHQLPAPVISIGNITMGGTGKTPLVIYVAQLLSKFGFAPAVLTRGYGKTRPGELHVLRPEESVPFPAKTLGDEPALIRRRVPSAWMGVSKNRYRTGTVLSKRNARMVLVLDDGFQHRKLHRDLDIAIVDSSCPLGSDRVFPRGTLREPISALHRCDVIVINDSTDSVQNNEIETELRHLETGAKIFHCRQEIRSLIPFPSWSEGQDKSTDRGRPARLPATAYLVSAIGNPERFRRDVLQFGIEVRGARFFADHYRLEKQDWQNCCEGARRKGAATIITTEKDAVKIGEPPDFPLLVAVQSTTMFDAGAFELVLKKSIEARV